MHKVITFPYPIKTEPKKFEQKKVGPVVSRVVWKQRKALSAKCTSCFIKKLLPNLQTTVYSHQLFPSCTALEWK